MSTHWHHNVGDVLLYGDKKMTITKRLENTPIYDVNGDWYIGETEEGAAHYINKLLVDTTDGPELHHLSSIS